jgi:uncharacterized protein (UPF0305 family)
MEKFSITNLKKALNQKSKKELITEISTLCKKFPQVKDYYKVKNFDSTEILEKYVTIIEKEFVDGKTRGFPKGRISVAKKAIQDFKKLTEDPLLLVDLMFTFVECISNFNSDFGVDEEKYYNAPEDMFKKALTLLQAKKLLHNFQERAHEIVENACEAWGHLDSLQNSYEEFYENFV